MALSSDFVIRVAPGLSATAAGADPDVVANRAMVLSLITGILALAIGYALEIRRMRTPSQDLLEEWETSTVGPTDGDLDLGSAPTIGHGVALRREADAAAARDDGAPGLRGLRDAGGRGPAGAAGALRGR